jgi:hypothetical protein
MTSTSVESDRGSLANAVKLMERADEHVSPILSDSPSTFYHMLPLPARVSCPYFSELHADWMSSFYCLPLPPPPAPNSLWTSILANVCATPSSRHSLTAPESLRITRRL